MKISSLIGVSGVAVLAVMGATARPVAAKNLNKSETTFVKNLAKGNVGEIELANLAQQKASNRTVEDFANRMVQDHTTLNAQQKTWAQQNHVTLPTSASQAAITEKNKL
jgi:putative membrane protein